MSKDYTVHCIDCLCVLGVSKKKTWDMKIRCLKCAKKEIATQKTSKTTREDKK